MAEFKNETTGNVITAHGPVAEAYRKRDAWTELPERAVVRRPVRRQPRKRTAKEPAAANETAATKESDK
jgi:hypothetical protein